MAAATPPSPIDWTWPVTPGAITHISNSPLELQLLPPASSASSSSPSPWGVDPSRLQQLMMGSVSALKSTSTSIAAVVTAVASGATPDVGAVFDGGLSEPLPSGWERCLDLKSGEVYVKKCDTGLSVMPGSYTLTSSHSDQSKEWNPGTSRVLEASAQTEKQRQEWSHRWLQEKISSPLQQEAHNISKSFLFTSAMPGIEGGIAEKELSGLDLDLDLRLTNENRSKLTLGIRNTSLHSPKATPPKLGSDAGALAQKAVQQWKWQNVRNGGEQLPTTNIHELVKESTMATAVCSKCLTYVLLRKSNPVCPRCSLPIVLDSALVSVSKKRPRLELSSDDLSLSTDSSR